MEQSNRFLTWLIFGLITAAVLAGSIYDNASRTPEDPYSLGEFLINLVPVFFALVGALIISHHPRNKIGQLMMLPGISLFVLIDALLRPYLVYGLPPPSNPSNLFLVVLWFSNWNWLLLVFPLMFIMVLFPTGKPLSPRWGRVNMLGIGLGAVIIAFSTFTTDLLPGAGGVDWALPNPIGFLEPAWIERVIPVFLILLVVWVMSCFSALLVRFRRSTGNERVQIKWLFYAAAVFVLCYVPSFLQGNFSDAESIFNLLFVIGLLVFPLAIGITILRYRLYDIDLIIRRTLQYVLLTGVLGLVYFGGVVLVQGVVGPLTGQENSPLVTVVTTLGIAAIFNPLRIRIQEFIDRRFYRRKYDAERMLNELSGTVRDEVDLNKLTTAIMSVVDHAIQPEILSLWLDDDTRVRKRGS